MGRWNEFAYGRLAKHATRTTATPPANDAANAEIDKLLGVDDKPVDEAARRTWAQAALKATRARAEGWRNGAAATLALVLASLAIKPGEGLMKYQGTTRDVLMALVGGSVLAALLSVYRLIRAANGPAWLLELSEDASADRWLRRVAGARLDLQLGQQLWVFSVILFAAAVAVTWVQT